MKKEEGIYEFDFDNKSPVKIIDIILKISTIILLIIIIALPTYFVIGALGVRFNFEELEFNPVISEDGMGFEVNATFQIQNNHTFASSFTGVNVNLDIINDTGDVVFSVNFTENIPSGEKTTITITQALIFDDLNDFDNTLNQSLYLSFYILGGFTYGLIRTVIQVSITIDNPFYNLTMSEEGGGES